MEVVITAVGPDNRGLADPIVHQVTADGANIAEIQMYDRDEASQFAMLIRVHLDPGRLPDLRKEMAEIGRAKGLSVRVWAPAARTGSSRLAVCTTIRTEPARALLEAIRDGLVPAEVAVMIGNNTACEPLAAEFGIPWKMIGDDRGRPDNDQFVETLDAYDVDFIILARYMRILPPEICWEFAGGRIVNLHHGLLPAFPGMRPYHAAHASHMLTYGATCHFIVPELDAGNQIIYQSTFTVPPGLPLPEIIERGHAGNEPHCLVEGVRRVASGEVRLHFHRVVAA